MSSPFRSGLRVIGQGLSLSFWRRPRSRVELTGFGTFLIAALLATGVFLIQDYADTDKPAQFHGEGWGAHAGYFLMVLIAAWATARALRRPALWLVLATLAAVFSVPWFALAIQLPVWLDQADDLQLDAWQILLAMASFLVSWQALKFLAAECSAPRRLLATALFVAIMAGPWYAREESWLWYPVDQGEDSPESPSDGGPVTEIDKEDAVPAPSFDPETVMADQPRLLQSELATLRPQTPGKIDLYTVGFAGDGSESVFRNEVEYFSELMSRRFGAEGRTLSLINSPDSVSQVPLATLSNLRSALAALGNRVDRHEDVLLLFLTSHGSRDHQLYVGMDPLPLDQIDAQNLRAVLDSSGIENRVVVVSACYSGGFVDALRDAHTLVITAARADRSSFGCGTDSDITFFGRAFLTEALNRTTDFEQGFAIANRLIRERELAEGDTPSVPQIAAGAAIGDKLRQFEATLPADESVVAFRPTPPDSRDTATAHGRSP